MDRALSEQNQAPVNAPRKTGNGEPRTLVEFTKKATKATKKSINSAGKNTQKAIKNTGKAIAKTGTKIKDFTDKVGSGIKTATKTTWWCLTSLFFNCSGRISRAKGNKAFRDLRSYKNS